MSVAINYPDTVHVDISRTAGGWAVLKYTPRVGIEVMGEYEDRKDAEARLREIEDEKHCRPGVGCTLTMSGALPPPSADDGGRRDFAQVKAARASAGVVNLFVDAEGWSETLTFEREDAAKIGWALVRAADDRV